MDTKIAITDLSFTLRLKLLMFLSERSCAFIFVKIRDVHDWVLGSKHKYCQSWHCNIIADKMRMTSQLLSRTLGEKNCTIRYKKNKNETQLELLFDINIIGCFFLSISLITDQNN
jgi:hypothetical protein